MTCIEFLRITHDAPMSGTLVVELDGIVAEPIPADMLSVHVLQQMVNVHPAIRDRGRRVTVSGGRRINGDQTYHFRYDGPRIRLRAHNYLVADGGVTVTCGNVVGAGS